MGMSPDMSAVASILVSVALAGAMAQSQEHTYEGVATPLISTTIKFGYNDAYRGIVTYVAAPGTIVRGTTYGLDGKVVEPGDVLIHMETDYRQSAVEGKQAILKSAEATLKNAQENYERYAKLIKTDATSMQIYQQNEATYFAALGAKEAAEADLQLAVIMRDACTFRSPFDATVDKVFFPAGLCSGELDIVRISQLSPMGIRIAMSREAASRIAAGTAVAVHLGNSGGSVGVLHGAAQLVEDGIILQVANRPVPPPPVAGDDGSRLPVCDYSTVMPQHSGKAAGPAEWLRIPSDALFSDGEGIFVWRAAGSRDMEAGKGLPMVFTVERLRLPGKELPKDVASKSIVVRNGEALGAFDIVLSGQVPASLKSGDKVCGHKLRYLLMPGDPVKVVIGGHQKQ